MRISDWSSDVCSSDLTLSRFDQPSRSMNIFPSRFKDISLFRLPARVKPGFGRGLIGVRLFGRPGYNCGSVLSCQGGRVDFRFTEEQLMIQDVARRIGQEKIAPSAEHHDRSGEFPLEIGRAHV